MTLSKLNAGIT